MCWTNFLAMWQNFFFCVLLASFVVVSVDVASVSFFCERSGIKEKTKEMNRAPRRAAPPIVK